MQHGTTLCMHNVMYKESIISMYLAEYFKSIFRIGVQKDNPTT